MINERVNFSKATRRVLFPSSKEEPVRESAAKAPRRHTRLKITMNIDGDIVDFFREKSLGGGLGYQQLINQALREYIEGNTPERLAKEVREALLDDEAFLKRLSLLLSEGLKSGT